MFQPDDILRVQTDMCCRANCFLLSLKYATSKSQSHRNSFVISSQKHLNYHIPLSALITVNTGGPTLMLIKCAQIL